MFMGCSGGRDRLHPPICPAVDFTL